MQKYCPECGHELTDRGRFCQFCGYDRKGKSDRVMSGGSVMWNPHESNASDRRKPTLVFFIFIVVIALIVASVLIIQNVGEKAMKDIAIQQAHTFQGADNALTEVLGFERDGDSYEENGVLIQKYKGKKLYGYKTTESYLECEKKTGNLYVWCSYNEGVQSKENTDDLFDKIKLNMDRKYGASILTVYEEDGFEGDYAYWTDGDWVVALFKMEEGVMLAARYEGNGGVNQ